MKKLRIYIAGPYTPSGAELADASRIANQNVKKAIDAAIALIKKGHIPLVPVLHHFIRIESDVQLPSDYFFQYDLALLHESDAFLYLGKSPGVDKELEEGKKINPNMLIFYSVEDIGSATE
ncbi:MAG: hypothetical protein QXF41_00970 [Candidatus Micrarchaeaceae archaeon]